jgi:hypothetical protein
MVGRQFADRVGLFLRVDFRCVLPPNGGRRRAFRVIPASRAVWPDCRVPGPNRETAGSRRFRTSLAQYTADGIVNPATQPRGTLATNARRPRDDRSWREQRPFAPAIWQEHAGIEWSILPLRLVGGRLGQRSRETAASGGSLHIARKPSATGATGRRVLLKSS